MLKFCEIGVAFLVLLGFGFAIHIAAVMSPSMIVITSLGAALAWRFKWRK